MIYLLHRYRPFTVSALLDLARYDAQEHQKRVYTADMIWLIAKYLSRGHMDAKSPSQLAADLEKGNAARQDTRTGRQIIDDLCTKLRSLRKG